MRHHLPSPLNPGLGARKREPQPVVDFLLWETLDFRQDERFPISIGQRIQKWPQAFCQVSVGTPVQIFARLRKVLRHRFEPNSVVRSIVIDQGVARDLI